jgi:hypothetical protein
VEFTRGHDKPLRSFLAIASRSPNALHSCNATIGRHIYANMVSITANDSNTGSAGAIHLATGVARP